MHGHVINTIIDDREGFEERLLKSAPPVAWHGKCPRPQYQTGASRRHHTITNDGQDLWLEIELVAKSGGHLYIKRR